MKTIKRLFVTFLLMLCSAVFLAACGGGSGGGNGGSGGSGGGNGGGNGGVQTFMGIVFEDDSVVYDGQAHTITATGVPSFATVTYEGEGPHTNAGSYPITVTVSAENYTTFTKTATLTITPASFTGIVFEDDSVAYDGQAHTITATGVPSFATVTYEGEGPHTNAGSYPITVTVSAENYTTFTKTATLTINKVPFVGVSFSSQSFEYDGQEHAIYVEGALPATAQVVYSSNTAGVTNAATEIGSYLIQATITDINHVTLTLEATLKITASDDARFMCYTQNGMLYFQNAMDDDELYAYDTAASSWKRVSGETAVDMLPYGGNGMLYVSKTPFVSAIKTISYDKDVAAPQFVKETVYTGNVRYIQNGGSSVFYYVKNGLTQAQSGIYKIDCSDQTQDPVVTLISEGKAKHLQLVGSTLYFADGANSYKLSKIDLTADTIERTLVLDVKIKNLMHHDGALYYTVNNLTGDYIEKYNISAATTRKLTIDAGESLTVVGDYLYYVNVDWFTTTVIGNGIYRVSTSPLVDYQMTGTKLIDGGEMGVCSLYSDGTNLYYYDVDGYKLMRYNIATQTKTNLLEGFVKPEDPKPISTGSKLLAYEGNIYYLDIWDGKTLHCYNPETKNDYPVTTGKVVDFAIINDVLYVNMVSWFVNNDIYCVDLKVGGELQKINTYSAFDFCSDGTYLYYIEENAAGAKTAIHRCDLDGTQDEIIYDKGVSNLRLVGQKLYYVEDNNIYAFDIATRTATVIEVDGREIHTTAFDTDGTYLYYRDMYGLAYANKRLARCKLDGTEDVKIVTSKCDPIVIVCQDGYVYFYTDTATSASTNGLYRVSASAGADTTPTQIVLSSSYYATNFVAVGDTVYFVDYRDQARGGCHFYCVRIGGAAEKLD